MKPLTTIDVFFFSPPYSARYLFAVLALPAGATYMLVACVGPLSDAHARVGEDEAREAARQHGH